MTQEDYRISQGGNSPLANGERRETNDRLFQQGMLTAGSQSTGGITGGRMYLLEGSWDPIDPLIGGPPGIPGSPCPTEPNDFPALELVVDLTPGVTTDVGPAVETPALGVVVGKAACGVCPA